MDYSDLILHGSVTDPSTYPELVSAKEFLSAYKSWKLLSRHEKNKDAKDNIRGLTSHLYKEVAELRVALEFGYGSEAILSELADVSNVVDILAMLLLRRRDEQVES